MSMPELVENAEEELYYRRPIVEAQRQVTSAADFVDMHPGLLKKIGAASDKVMSSFAAISADVLKLVNDSRIYRADFIIGGLHAINIRFSFLRFRTGWFFGRRPEFHFPKLPLGWATLGTWILLPPLALAAIALTIGISIAIGLQLLAVSGYGLT